jgi:uncharacterized protein (DUF305 family)
MNNFHTALALSSTAMLLGLGACAPMVGYQTASEESSVAEESGAFSSTDLMFAAMMIPHHQQAVEMGLLALEKSTNEDVRELAGQIVDGQGPEIAQMKDWLSAGGEGAEPSAMDHEAMGHDMPSDGGMMAGMASDEDLALLASLSSPEFDRLFLELMIDHHEGALDMVEMIENSGNDEARSLAEAIMVTQRAEIAKMSALLEGALRP